MKCFQEICRELHNALFCLKSEKKGLKAWSSEKNNVRLKCSLDVQ